MMISKGDDLDHDVDGGDDDGDVDGDNHEGHHEDLTLQYLRADTERAQKEVDILTKCLTCPQVCPCLTYCVLVYLSLSFRASCLSVSSYGL